MKSLLVDPSLTSRRTWTHVLRQMGRGNFLEASTVAEALEFCDGDGGSDIDLVVTEWDLPDGPTGIDLLGDLRSRDGFSSTPVVVVSARASREDVLAAIKAGASDYLLKPVSQETLREHLDEVFRSHAAAANAEGDAPEEAPTETEDVEDLDQAA